ncbi:family 16 glycosylhydrolase [Methylobacterium persicinum]|uniref:Beta-glucanase (GH16 family) n=1 Tax=Methylobacterium persicinum TaxID=374426 RepID=A0ABU0HLS7_9HYPH|nr:family 16 glycosylhydrolase [Methylobacterium persicinum]MDQ0443284.1 beta-glucanase (GH16 family) [Methylobacterium persicinum]GJE38140.1 hypothetical protein KHHGKMAE_2207 [Methylobacterium persicinum]
MLDLTGYKLTFDDEFNTRSISQTGAGTTWADIRQEWRYDANSDIGFGHSSFVDPASGYDPFHVAGGALTITAVPDQTSAGYPGSWESGLITTQGNFSQTYGYFEIRADFSSLKGAWDAFWLLPVNSLPDPNNAGRWQELDVVEHYGANDKGVYSTIHTTDAAPNQNWQQELQVYSELTSSPGYHTYGMDWEADKISFYVDGHLVGSQATPSDMHGPMYLLADLATQSDADAAGVPISSSIDYIRAYSNAPNAVAIAQDTVSAPDGNDPGTYGATVAKPVASVSPTTAVSAPAATQSVDTASTGTVTPVSSATDTSATHTTDSATVSNTTTAAVAATSTTSSQAAVATTTSAADTATVVNPAAGATASSNTNASDHLSGVYRFYDTHTGDHFFTASASEAEQIKATIPYYNYEGVSWASPDKGAGTEDVFRFFDSKSGTHFFTASTTERDQIIASNGTYHYEGVAFEVYAANTGAPGMETLERFYNTTTGLHHLASSAEAYGINHGAAGTGWVDEGAAFTVHTADGLLLA